MGASGVSSSTNNNLQAVESEPLEGGVADPKPAESTNSVESYEHDLPGGVAYPTEPDGPTVSPHELEALAAKGDDTEPSQLTTALNEVSDQLDVVAGSGYSTATAVPLESKLLASEAFQAAAASLPRAEVLAALKNEFAERGLTADKANSLAKHVVEGLSAGMTSGAAFAMQKTVIDKLDSAADAFQAAAKDPAGLAKTCETLAKLESPGATEAQRERAAASRKELGLPKNGPVTPELLSKALTARAGLMRHEASYMQETPQLTYRTLLTHDVGKQYLKEAGIAPGSWAATQLAAVKTKGEEQEEELANRKLVLGIALGVAGAGLGIIGASGGAVLVANAPDLAVAVGEIDSAAAGESAGTAARGAQTRAEQKVRTKVQGMVIEAASALALSKVGHNLTHALEHGMGELGAKAAVFVPEAAAEYGVGKAIEQHEYREHGKPGAASGKTALERVGEE